MICRWRSKAPWLSEFPRTELERKQNCIDFVGARWGRLERPPSSSISAIVLLANYGLKYLKQYSMTVTRGFCSWLLFIPSVNSRGGWSRLTWSERLPQVRLVSWTRWITSSKRWNYLHPMRLFHQRTASFSFAPLLWNGIWFVMDSVRLVQLVNNQNTWVD